MSEPSDELEAPEERSSSADDGDAGPVGAVGASGIRSLSPTDLIVAAIGVAATVAVVVAFGQSPIAAGLFAVVLLTSTALSIIDFREHRLPNRIVGPLALGVVVSVVAAGIVNEDLGRSWRALGMGLALSVVLFAVNVVGGIGMGDVKYGFPMAATVGWFGWDALSIAIMFTTVAAAVVAVVVLLQGRGKDHQLAYGPYMALGLAVGLLAAAPG